MGSHARPTSDTSSASTFCAASLAILCACCWPSSLLRTSAMATLRRRSHQPRRRRVQGQSDDASRPQGGTHFTPCRASSVAHALPRPLAPPVMSATLPSSSSQSDAWRGWPSGTAAAMQRERRTARGCDERRELERTLPRGIMPARSVTLIRWRRPDTGGSWQCTASAALCVQRVLLPAQHLCQRTRGSSFWARLSDLRL